MLLPCSQLNNAAANGGGSAFKDVGAGLLMRKQEVDAEESARAALEAECKRADEAEANLASAHERLAQLTQQSNAIAQKVSDAEVRMSHRGAVALHGAFEAASWQGVELAWVQSP